MFPPLTPALGGSRRVLQGPVGSLNVYVAGVGPPILLIHSVNAAASAYEVKPIAEAMAGDRQVWVPDLPGFGLSDRSDRRYDLELYLDAIESVLDAIGEATGSRAVDVLALSLSGEFAARLALKRPECFRTLALVNPTGFNARAARSQRSGTYEVPGLHAFLSFRLWARGLFDALVTRPSIRFFLRGTFGSKTVDPGLIDYAWRTAHQPGARFAPFAFVCGRLFSRDVVALFKALELPVWMPHGVRGDFRDFSGADWARSKANWTVESFDTGAFPHFEQSSMFVAAYRRFLEVQGS